MRLAGNHDGFGIAYSGNYWKTPQMPGGMGNTKAGYLLMAHNLTKSLEEGRIGMVICAHLVPAPLDYYTICN